VAQAPGNDDSANSLTNLSARGATKVKLVQVFQKFLVKFGLQFKSKTWEQLCRLF
jgi:hypothetical protein